MAQTNAKFILIKVGGLLPNNIIVNKTSALVFRKPNVHSPALRAHERPTTSAIRFYQETKMRIILPPSKIY